jgi:uncharacterized membrane protein YvlD (DUF360 family)
MYELGGKKEKMSDFDTGIGKTVGIYAIVLGLLYIAVSGIGSVGPIPGNDALGGLFFFVIAATYLMGVKGTANGEYRGLSFLLGGFFLSLVYGIVYILMIGGDAVAYVIGDTDVWSWLVEFRPSVWLFIIALPFGYLIGKLTKDMSW